MSTVHKAAGMLPLLHAVSQAAGVEHASFAAAPALAVHVAQ